MEDIYKMEQELYAEIANTIREKKLTIEQVHQDTKIDKETLTELMNGTLQGATMKTLLKLVTYLDIELSMNFSGKDE